MKEPKSEMEEELSPRYFEESKPNYSWVRNIWRQNNWCENSIPITLRPTRLIQLIIDIMLISVTISILTSLETNPVGTAASIILIILFGSFAIVMSIDTVGQMGGYLTPDLLMFFVALLGLILFSSAAQAVYLLVYQDSKNRSILVLIGLCLAAALLFLLDAMTMIMYWRYNCNKNGKCLPCHPGQSFATVYQRSAHEKDGEILEARHDKPNPMTRDVSTSFSQDSQRSFNSGFLDNRNDNQVGFGPRRQYVDSPTNPGSNTSLKLVGTQTRVVESAEHMDHEISAIPVVEEKDVQTLSQCPMCSAALDHSPEGICPSFLALAQRFGMFSCTESLQLKPGAPVLMDRGTLPGSNPCCDVTESTVKITKKAPRVYETRACPTHGAGLIAQKAGLPIPVKRISLTHSIRKNKRTQTPTSKSMVITDKYQNTEVNAVEEMTNTESSHPRQDNFSGEKSSEKVEIPIKENVNLVKIAGSTIGLKKKSSQHLQDRFDERKSSELEGEREKTDSSSGKFQAAIQDRAELPEIEERFPKLEDETNLPNNTFENIEEYSTGSKILSSLTEKPVSFTSPSNFEQRDILVSDEKNHPQWNIFQKNNKVESLKSTVTLPIRKVSSTFAEATSPLKSIIRSAEISRHSNECREMANLRPPCKCSHYYYKDVFGRYICGLCAHKYLIKIPQRCSIKPVGDIRCYSCSQAIFHQAPNAGQTICRNCCRCRYKLYAGSTK